MYLHMYECVCLFVVANANPWPLSPRRNATVEWPPMMMMALLFGTLSENLIDSGFDTDTLLAIVLAVPLSAKIAIKTIVTTQQIVRCSNVSHQFVLINWKYVSFHSFVVVVCLSFCFMLCRLISVSCAEAASSLWTHAIYRLYFLRVANVY